MDLMTTTKSRKGSRKSSRGPSQASQDRQAEVELLATQFDDQAPDYLSFRALWADRYSESNLARLWAQCPRATQLHRFGTWRGMGRAVRKGERAVWLRIPHTSHSEDKITAENPTGEVFTGAPWMALFDFSQTGELGEDFTEEAAPDASPDALAEVKRLRMAAVRLHPDTTGDPGTAPAFMAAWAAYEAARDALKSTS